jgi:hypothetical protein
LGMGILSIRYWAGARVDYYFISTIQYIVGTVA